jgi:hypothetical protein
VIRTYARYGVILAATLAALGALSFLYLALNYNELRNENSSIFVLLLYVLFGGYVGIPLLIFSGLALLWTRGGNSRKAAIIIVALIAFNSIPNLSRCRYSGDIGVCSQVRMYETEYWTYAWKTITSNPQEHPVVAERKWDRARWITLLVREGYGDVLREIRRAKGY